jgi:3-hydroxyacyl-[acyl-carrier-protein] dehydratase
MKLLNNLYTISERETTFLPVRYDVSLQEKSLIYQAHFPGEPITPGVCIIQIAKELLEDYAQKRYQIKTIKNVKFLNVISPVTTPHVTYVFEKIVNDETSKTCRLQVQVLAAEAPLAKLSFTCQEI